MLDVADDREALYDTHAEWLKAAETMVSQLPVKPVRVNVQVDALLAWCRAQGVPLNGAARSQYAADEVRRAAVGKGGVGEHGSQT